MPAMHTKPSATCHCYSQALNRREALEHAHRQRRDLIVAEPPAQAHAQRLRVVKQLPRAHAHRHMCVSTATYEHGCMHTHTHKYGCVYLSMSMYVEM